MFAMLLSLVVSACGVPLADDALLISERPLVDDVFATGGATGIAVGPHGKIFVLTSDGVLLERVFGGWRPRFHGRWGGATTFEDVVYLDGNVFAITTTNMGFWSTWPTACSAPTSATCPPTMASGWKNHPRPRCRPWNSPER